MSRNLFNPYMSAELESMPTIAVGQAADLKIEEDGLRWWLNRCGPEDGEMFRVEAEQLTDGRWVVAGEFEPL